MKKLLVVLAGCLLVGNALAQDPDEICIVFDPGVCSINCQAVGVGQPFDFYVVLQNASSQFGVSGFEFCLCNEDGSPLLPPPGEYFVTGQVLPPGAVNIQAHPCYVVGLAVPLPWEPCITLLTVNCLSFGTVPWCFGVEPTDLPSIPGEMAYAAGNDPGDLRVMRPCVGPNIPSCLTACVNSEQCPPPIATEDVTWGGVKSLYR